MDRALPSQSAACYVQVGLLTSKLGSFGPSRRCSPRSKRNTAGGTRATMACKIDEPYFACGNTDLVTAAGPSRICTGFPVRRPSHRSGRPPTPNQNVVILPCGRLLVNWPLQLARVYRIAIVATAQVTMNGQTDRIVDPVDRAVAESEAATVDVGAAEKVGHRGTPPDIRGLARAGSPSSIAGC